MIFATFGEVLHVYSIMLSSLLYILEVERLTMLLVALEIVKLVRLYGSQYKLLGKRHGGSSFILFS